MCYTGCQQRIKRRIYDRKHNMTSLNKLIVIDGQNDFSDTPESLRPVIAYAEVEGQLVPVRQTPALAVPGGHDALLRTAGFIREAGPLLNRIVATLDAHPFVAIERTTFWVDAEGNEVKPFTEITSDMVFSGRYRPVHANRIEPISQKPLVDRVVELLLTLEASGKFKLMVWPVHCVKATWGASLHPAIAEVLNEWEREAAFPVVKVDKGSYPLVEHYGVFEAETPLFDVPSTRFNGELAETLNADITIFAGLASSHCVPASYDQLVRWRKTGKGIIVLMDCMSPVAGFEQAEAEFFTRAAAAGSLLMTAAEAAQYLRDRA